MRSMKAGGARSTRSSTSATAWRRTSTDCARAPASWRSSAFRCSLFQEGGDETAARAFREIARLTKGAFCRFDPGSARQLRDLLTAVAVYAAGGRKALLALSGKSEGAGARLLLAQLSSGAAGA